MSLLEELSKKGIIAESQIGEIKVRAHDKFGGDLDQALIESGVSEDTLLEIKGEYMKIPIKQINPQDMSFDVLKYISEDSATHYRFVPLELKDGVLSVGVVDPGNTQAMDALQFISANLGIPFKIFLITKSVYEDVMESYKGINNQIGEALGEIGEDSGGDTKNFNSENLDKEIKNIKGGDVSKIVEDAPVIKIVAVI